MSDLKTNLQEILQEKQEKIIPENIKKGVNILGVTGTMNSGIDTSDANATANDITIDKTAYVNGQKITGTLPLFPNTRTFTVSNAGVTNNTEDSTLDLTTINTTKQILDSNVSMNFNADYSDVATAIGLTADKITSGNTILGIEGIVDPEGVQITDYFNTTPEDGQSLVKAYPDTIDCSKLTMFNFYNDFQNTYVPNLINTENVFNLSNIANQSTLGFTQTELDASSMSSFTNALSYFSNITSVPKLKNLLKNQFYDGFSLDMTNMYKGCTNLETIPEFEIIGDWSIITVSPMISVGGMVDTCPKLSEQSITNILNFLKLLNDHNAQFDAYTLADVGLSYSQLTNLTEDQLAIINSMDNWTTGLEQFDTAIEIGNLYNSVNSEQITLDETLSEYLTLVETYGNMSIDKWLLDITVDYAGLSQQEFNTKEDLISALNNIKFRSTADTINLVINLSVKLTDGNQYNLTNGYENIISTHTTSSINLDMIYTPIQLNIDTKGKDLAGWNIELMQSDGMGSLTSLRLVNGNGRIPIDNNVVLVQTVNDISYNEFLLQLYPSETVAINRMFMETGFTKENLTFTFSIGGSILPDISQENTAIYNMMILYDEHNMEDYSRQASIYFNCYNIFDVVPDQIEFYSQNLKLIGAINSWGTTDTEYSGTYDILDETYDVTDITAYSYGPAKENDTSL